MESANAIEDLHRRLHLKSRLETIAPMADRARQLGRWAAASDFERSVTKSFQIFARCGSNAQSLEPFLTLTDSMCGDSESANMINRAVCQRLEACPHRFYFNRVSWKIDGGVLQLEGQVPTFHLKQILQTLLRGIEHVDRIENNVQVLSSRGLSDV